MGNQSGRWTCPLVPNLESNSESIDRQVDYRKKMFHKARGKVLKFSALHHNGFEYSTSPKKSQSGRIPSLHYYLLMKRLRNRRFETEWSRTKPKQNVSCLSIDIGITKERKKNFFLGNKLCLVVLFVATHVCPRFIGSPCWYCFHWTRCGDRPWCYKSNLSARLGIHWNPVT